VLSADRPTGRPRCFAGDDAFRERMIEAVATSEEAVVGKDTRA
jgi:hypothetical protein